MFSKILLIVLSACQEIGLHLGDVFSQVPLLRLYPLTLLGTSLQQVQQHVDLLLDVRPHRLIRLHVLNFFFLVFLFLVVFGRGFEQEGS